MIRVEQKNPFRTFQMYKKTLLSDIIDLIELYENQVTSKHTHLKDIKITHAANLERKLVL